MPTRREWNLVLAASEKARAHGDVGPLLGDGRKGVRQIAARVLTVTVEEHNGVISAGQCVLGGSLDRAAVAQVHRMPHDADIRKPLGADERGTLHLELPSSTTRQSVPRACARTSSRVERTLPASLKQGMATSARA